MDQAQAGVKQAQAGSFEAGFGKQQAEADERQALAALKVAQSNVPAVQAQGAIALGLIQVYRALGGGWELRLTGPAAPAGAVAAGPPAAAACLPAAEVRPADAEVLLPEGSPPPGP